MTALAFGVLTVGCGGDADSQAVTTPVARPAPPPPPPPPAPTVTPIADLMAQLSIDPRVVLPEDKAPSTDEERIAVLEFFDAFARGDADVLGTMLSGLDRIELEELTKTSSWSETIAGIDEIMIETGPGPYSEMCALAVFDVNGAFQPQLWYYGGEDREPSAEGFTFEAAPTPPGIIDKLYGDDWIGRWHALLEEEMALANALDVDFERAQVNLSSDRGGGSVPGTAPGGGKRPGFGPGGGGGGRRPIGKKRKPPGAMPGG